MIESDSEQEAKQNALSLVHPIPYRPGQSIGFTFLTKATSHFCSAAASKPSSSTSRTFRANEDGVNGLLRKAIPVSSTP